MSGRRRKALVAEFRRKHGRAPRKAKQDRLGGWVQQDEIRPPKKAYARGQR